MSQLQQNITSAGQELTKAFLDKKAASGGLRELRKELKNTLSEDLTFAKLSAQEAELNKAKKGIADQLLEIKKDKEAISMETDEHKELDEFVDYHDQQFAEVKDRVITRLSSQIKEDGLTAEIMYKGGELHLIVIRS